MTDFNSNSGTTRDDLLQRVALMETMIAEGRGTTQRYGWVFVSWGLCYILAVAWSALGPHPFWAWPVCLTITIFAVNVGLHRQAKAAREPASSMSRTLGAIWMIFGFGIALFVVAAAVSHHIGDAIFVAVICFFLGTVNLTSAAIYRWKMQGLAGAIWWAAGVTELFVSPRNAGFAFVAATFLSQIVFGLYLMALEHRRGLGHGQRVIA